jgi:5-methyltetrahydrofolate--homocysteine methyltransferase
VLHSLEEAGAAAVGFNCVAADDMTPHLVSRLRRYIKCPILCKPNAGMPTIGDDQIAHYDMSPADFGRIISQCVQNGASLVGGCCGTTPDHIRAIISQKAL